MTWQRLELRNNTSSWNFGGGRVERDMGHVSILHIFIGFWCLVNQKNREWWVEKWKSHSGILTKTNREERKGNSEERCWLFLHTWGQYDWSSSDGCARERICYPLLLQLALVFGALDSNLVLYTDYSCCPLSLSLTQWTIAWVWVWIPSYFLVFWSLFLAHIIALTEIFQKTCGSKKLKAWEWENRICMLWLPLGPTSPSPSPRNSLWLGFNVFSPFQCEISSKIKWSRIRLLGPGKPLNIGW